MKKYKKLILLISCALLFVIFAAFTHNYYFAKGAPVIFEISEGQSGAQIARNLKRQGVIKSKFMFKMMLKFFFDPKGLKAGVFDLRQNTSPEEVISCISSGKCQHLEKVTILEGWRIEEIAMALQDKNICDAMDFTKMAKERNLEGYLYPSTYMFPQKMQTAKVIDAMVAEFNKRVRPLFQPEFMGGLTERQVITIASIVEREAVVHDERPKIAAVYLNRVKTGMRLEADPTVQYALGYTPSENRFWKKGLTLADLRKDMPYNTYKRKGIPPGPICSPSMESVYAVLHPEENFDKLFFVAENDEGRHVFSKTYDEHVRNIRRIRSNRK
ncbi:Putative aminodeoxychorismate lyase [Elusimicrobium minutum Pei191]|uniref:Endolytic murein transglycosylase n=1 Tax=Elusimicrobium minutum (strain Pei191) TaxID=445932 RepID=B2KD01_ELUMP|nr:endolytic transglycosylase MltG [Elusimicrobium minutum]ACC98397.1 Putative aminodeoxychorismate lyase [Elusimicrobium minutum Pei191]